ncbi:nodulation protein NfeD [Aquibacillus koreensis]|uniref:Nodulation protein NfeD n=1 Tax=Aquibacillus koreensis TaxID=279446 RepID=A0A9X4AI62_9BACI|nr:nodulation protein NfeD [Aquibacillus koreensis]MCT2537604.1 nodulation protein NfeD [Aquibacillus koreensis]MDC3419050.1 nodulation protein NfeD [Aquibacillus koreensis]
MILSAFVSLFYATPLQAQENGEGKIVYVIPIEKEVERGLEAFVERTTNEAMEANADHIIFEIDTPGGRVDAARNIATLLQDLDITTTSYITSDALSAGSYIALNTDNIYMTSTARMGASGVITSDGNAADKKAQSAWISAMESAATSKGRDPLYAKAMADADIDLSEYGAPKGEFLTLSPTSAVEVGYAEAIVQHRTELLTELGLSKAKVVESEPTVAEEIARFITNPIVVPILLSLASIGLVVELYSPGFGVPGSIGLLSLVLFFYGHIVAGLAGYEAIILLVLGIGLIIAELFVPGGILGIIGIAAVVGSLFMSSYDIGHMALSISIALVVTIIVSVILFKRLGLERGIFKHIILSDATTTEKGYVSTVNRLDLIGLQGEAVTPLRPSGTAVFDDERLDVVSEGGFIGDHATVKIVKVEGSRIVVREI